MSLADVCGTRCRSASTGHAVVTPAVPCAAGAAPIVRPYNGRRFTCPSVVLIPMSGRVGPTDEGSDV